MIRVLVVDDEPLARGVITHLLRQMPDVEMIGECGDGREAVQMIQTRAPDLVFLDIQMPGMDGFGVIRAIPPENLPLIVFVTAFDEYAVQAFDVHAIDYLLKPFTDERFDQAFARARELLNHRERSDFADRLLALIAEQDLAAAEHPSLNRKHPPKARDTRFAIKSGSAVYLLDAEEIDWVEAANNFVRFHAGGKRHLMRATISSIEQRLDPNEFVRIHRSTIVRVDRIRQLQPQVHGDFQVILRDGTPLRMSRRRREELRARLPY
jgi:two-component system, LytTR family, response regulator